MSSIQSKLIELFSNAFTECGYDSKFGLVVESQRPDLGQFQCNGALAAAKPAKKNPQEIAQNIIANLKDNEMLANLSIAGPGFINVTVKGTWIARYLNSITKDPRLGCSKALQPDTIVIDFGSPNVAKPMHVGHLRSAIIGDSLQRLLTFLGHNVIGDNHVGDWGTQMGMLLCELQRREPTLPYFDSSSKGPYPEESPLSIGELEEMYPVASKKCNEDENLMAEAISATDELQQGREGYVALWKHFVNLSIKTLKEDFDSLDITFNHWLGESFYKERMSKIVKWLKDKGFAQESEGALILHVGKENDKKEIPPVMLEKSSGGFLYATSDIATIDYRIEKFNVNKILYVVDKRQGLHFEQIFRAVRKTGIVKPTIVLEHIGFGTVNGPDGKPFKTREGGVMKLGDLIDLVTQKAEQRMEEAGIAQELSKEEHLDIARKVGIAALKFADLMNHRTSDYVFDLDKFSRFEGKTGPYLLYTAVRIKSILRKTGKENITEGEIITPTDSERTLMLLLSQLPDICKNTEEGYAPSYICDFTYNLAQEFNRFYKECHILREKDKKKQGSWLGLANLCLKELELLLDLLGIQIPEKM